jgi:transposase
VGAPEGWQVNVLRLRRGVSEIAEVYQREVRDLPCFEYRTTVAFELYRVRCPDCGLKTEKILQLPSKAPFSKRFEDAVGESCESATARRVAKQYGMAASTVRSIDLRYLERWGGGAAETRVAADGSGRDSPG